MTSVEIDLPVGGTWRYAMVTNNGTEVAFHGEYREIMPYGHLHDRDEHLQYMQDGLQDAMALFEQVMLSL